MSVFDGIMILLVAGAFFMAAFVVVHTIYTVYKERQWRKNNKDEWIRQESIRRGYESED